MIGSFSHYCSCTSVTTEGKTPGKNTWQSAHNIIYSSGHKSHLTQTGLDSRKQHVFFHTTEFQRRLLENKLKSNSFEKYLHVMLNANEEF